MNTGAVGGAMVKAARFEMRVEPEQLKRWKAAAEADGRSLGDWLARIAERRADKALHILQEPKPGVYWEITRSEEKEIARIVLALKRALAELGDASRESDGMSSILRRLQSKKPN